MKKLSRLVACTAGAASLALVDPTVLIGNGTWFG